MKRIKTLLLTAVVTITYHYSFAQTTNTFPATGSAGIGTTSPLSLLHITGNVGSTDILRLGNTDASDGRSTILFTSSKGPQSWQFGENPGGGAGLFGLRDMTTSGFPIRFVVNTSGYMGIGTIAPTFLLSVGGNASSVSGGQSSVQYFPSSTSGIYGGHVTQLIASPAAASSGFYYGVLGEAGDGTGITSSFTNTITAVGGSTIHRGTGNITTLITFLATSPVITNGGTVSNAYGLYINNIKSTGITNSYGVFQSSASDPNYFAGNVGIGLANPQNKLDVNGTIHSKSVLVDLNGWSDYVFKKDYPLLSLGEVKAYIDQNHHLPEMPSEQEMIKNGLNVSEMNKLLTKKVEELTLYLIEKDLKDQEHRAEIAEQKKELGAMHCQLKLQEEKLNKLEAQIKTLSQK